jgi:hypothetical protein
MTSTNVNISSTHPPKAEMLPFIDDVKKASSVSSTVSDQSLLESTLEKTIASTLNKIKSTLNHRKINYKVQQEPVWILQENLKSTYEPGRNCADILIPGSKCALLRTFLGVRVTEFNVFLTQTSHRIFFPSDQQDYGIKFCNFLNSIQNIGAFFLNPQNNKLLVSARRVIFIKGKTRIDDELIDEIVSFDKMFQLAMIEHYPAFYIKFQILTLIDSSLKLVKSNFEVAKTSVVKAIKGMGFNQQHENMGKSAIGRLHTIFSAVNTDPLKNEKEIDWKVLPIGVDTTDFIITIYIKLCKCKHIVKIEDEASQNLLAEYINYANTDLKRAQFKFDYAKSQLNLEGSILTLGMDFTQIQAEFQDLYSYIIEVFKKHGNNLSYIFMHNKSPQKPEDPTSKSQSLKPSPEKLYLKPSPEKLYLETKKSEMDIDENEYSQFYINPSSKVPRYMQIPKSFYAITYKPSNYAEEKSLIERMKSLNIDEVYHVSFCDCNCIIRYPKFDGVPLHQQIGFISQNGINAFQDFIRKMIDNRFRVMRPFEVLSSSKEEGSYAVYFSSFPIAENIGFFPSGVPITLKTQLFLDLTSEILEAHRRGLSVKNEITYIEKESLENFNEELKEGYLIDRPVELTEITEAEALRLNSEPKFLGSCSDVHLAFFKEKDKFYVVREKLRPLNIAQLPLERSRVYVLEMINHLKQISAFKNSELHLAPTDLFITHDEKLKIIAHKGDPQDLWQCFDKTRSREGKLVYVLALILYKMLIKADPFERFKEQKDLTQENLILQLSQNIRMPLFPWEYENENPKTVAFLRQCFVGEIKSLETMKNRLPSEIYR